MRYPDSFLDEIRSRLPVSEVVKRRVQLKRQGREWRGLSPFNKEKTPSFFVNDQKGFYHDFSSGRNGDIFKFVMETEGLTFPEAVERLANLAGVPVPKISEAYERHERQSKTLYEVLEVAAKFFEANLASAVGAKARGYLADRGIKGSTQLEFRLGYAPAGRYALKEYLGAQGIPVPDMVEAGLLISGDDIPVPYDRFRDRVIIPIHDQRGRIVGFGGRALNPDVQPKYLNSPETALFHKGSIVFNFHRARQPAHDDGSVVVVEGYMDAISVYQAGLKSIVASMGTALTEGQIESLWRLSEEPIVCFDADNAGIGAAHRSVDRILPALKVGKTFRFAFLQEGKDPDELVRTKGLEAFKEVLEGALPLWDVLWERETSIADLRTPDGRAKLEHKLYTIVKTIADPMVHTAYYRTCRVELSDLFWQSAKSRQDGTKARKSGLLKAELNIQRDGYRHGLQKVLLGTLIHYPELIDDKSDEIATVHFSDVLEEFRQALYDLLIMHSEVDVELIYARLSPRYYDVLHDVHGDKVDGKPRGYRLFQRFPVLRLDPPREFVAECIDHFVNVLQVEQMAEELNRLRLEIVPGGNDLDALAERLTELVRDLHLRRELVNNRDVVLAEAAKDFRRLGQGRSEARRLVLA